jgi:hypothetical protein
MCYKKHNVFKIANSVQSPAHDMNKKKRFEKRILRRMYMTSRKNDDVERNGRLDRQPSTMTTR